MTGILQGNVALALGVLALVFVIASTVRMRRVTLAVLAVAALFATYAAFHVNEKLQTGEAVAAAEKAWLVNSGIMSCLVLIAACLVAVWLHLKYPCDNGREQLERSNAAIRVQR